MSFSLFRDVVLFVAGLGLAGYEVFTTPADAEPSLIVLGLAVTMMGLPGTLGVDRLLNRSDDQPPSPPSPPPVDDPPTDPPTRRRHR